MNNSQKTPLIFIIDDEPRMVEMIQMMLRKEGFKTKGFTSAVEAVIALGNHPVDVIITDLKMPEKSGLEILSEARRLQPDIEVIVITAFATVETAVEAMKLGARDYLTKPFPASALRTTVRFALDQKDVLKERSKKNSNAPQGSKLSESRASGNGEISPVNLEGFIANDEAMRSVLKKAEKVAKSNSSILIMAESGAGKEVLARAIHKSSLRNGQAWLKVNCAAIPENLLEGQLFGHVKGSFTGADRDSAGLFEAADGGTLFLDEIGEIPLQIQVKLLHVLQEGEFLRVGDTHPRKVDVRIIAATNKDLEEQMRRGEFRQDLFYRLNVVPIYIPPLRERPGDIEILIDHFLKKFSSTSQEITISTEARELLASYPWPGNIRELENAIEHAVVLCEEQLIDTGDLPAGLQNFFHKRESVTADAMPFESMQAELSLSNMEKSGIIRAMSKTGFNHTKAAKLLGITRRTLGYRIKKYELTDTLKKLKEDGKSSNGNLPQEERS